MKSIFSKREARLLTLVLPVFQVLSISVISDNLKAFFVHVHRTGPRRLIPASGCFSMVKTNLYAFLELCFLYPCLRCSFYLRFPTNSYDFVEENGRSSRA